MFCSWFSWLIHFFYTMVMLLYLIFALFKYKKQVQIVNAHMHVVSCAWTLENISLTAWCFTCYSWCGSLWIVLHDNIEKFILTKRRVTIFALKTCERPIQHYHCFKKMQLDFTLLLHLLTPGLGGALGSHVGCTGWLHGGLLGGVLWWWDGQASCVMVCLHQVGVGLQVVPRTLPACSVLYLNFYHQGLFPAFCHFPSEWSTGSFAAPSTWCSRIAKMASESVDMGLSLKCLFKGHLYQEQTDYETCGPCTVEQIQRHVQLRGCQWGSHHKVGREPCSCWHTCGSQGLPHLGCTPSRWTGLWS